jgi:hypothetical protein
MSDRDPFEHANKSTSGGIDEVPYYVVLGNTLDRYDMDIKEQVKVDIGPFSFNHLPSPSERDPNFRYILELSESTFNTVMHRFQVNDSNALNYLIKETFKSVGSYAALTPKLYKVKLKETSEGKEDTNEEL